jgi:hypothetical protein
MKYFSLCAATVAALLLSTASARAQTLFSYEVGELGMPYIGNPATYIPAAGVLGVTNGVASLQVTGLVIAFGGPQSAFLTDAARANAINAAPAVLIDMTLPTNATFGFGNIDLTFFQTNIRPGFNNDETGFSGTFALAAPGSTITLQIPLTNTQFGTPHLTLDPGQPWAYQIDLSFNSPSPAPYVFHFDNLRVVPEPATAALGALLGGGLVLRRRRA